MKRKLFSAILFGALLTASTSGLTSCKDYDDDISNLQSQIDKLATADQLSEKVSKLEDAIADAQSAAEAKAAAAEAVAKEAKAAAGDAAAAASKAQSTADTAAAAAAAADEVAKGAQKAIAELETKSQNAIAELEAKAATKEELEAAKKTAKEELEAAAKYAQEYVNQVKETIEKNHAADKTAIENSIDKAKTDLLAEIKKNSDAIAALKTRLDKVEAKLGMGEGGEDIDLTEIQKEIEAIEKDLEAIIGKVADMVTSVELFYNSKHTGYANQNDLDFNVFTEKKNETFGKDVADKILTTAEGHTKFYGAEVIIRVNPVDAEISASDISLINSKGEELTGFVEATKVERYSNKNYLTRAAGANTGLWKVTFAPVDGKKTKDLEKKFAVKVGSATKSILYGVAIKSAINDSISADRRVVSAYDVIMKISAGENYIAAVPGYTSPVAAADSVGIAVNNKWIKDIKNRYAGTNRELIWNTNQPAVTPVKPGASSGTVNTTDGDNRSGNAALVASVGEEINIKFAKKIKGFYVTLDRDFAESGSAPSEINAWDGYTYENVAKNGVKATMFEGSEGTIKVSELSHNVTGDEIGFRIYAMNLDGTLVDPDGVAFYVIVGEAQQADIDLGAKNLLVTKPAGVLAQTDNFRGDFVLPTEAFKGYTFGTIVCKNTADNSTLGSGNYDVWYKEGNNWKKTGISEMKNVTAVGIQIKYPINVKDDATYKVTIPLQKTTSTSQTYTVKNAVLAFTKKLPTSAPAFTWNEGQDEEQIVKTANYDTNIENALCIRGVGAPLGISTSITPGSPFPAKNGNLNYNDMFIQSGEGNPAINSDGKFIFSLAATKWNPTDRVFEPLKTTATGGAAPYAYNAAILPGLIDCTTPHAVSAAYNYGAISSENQDPRPGFTSYDWEVNTPSAYSIKYMTWSYKNANYLGFEWATQTVNKVTYTYDVNQTLTNIRIATDRFKAVHGSKLTTSLRKATLKDYLKAGWLQIKSVKTIGVETGIVNPYYEWDKTTASTDYTVLGLNKKAGVENIPAHSEKIQITVVDCFGHEETHELVLKFTIEPVNANAWLEPSR